MVIALGRNLFPVTKREHFVARQIGPEEGWGGGGGYGKLEVTKSCLIWIEAHVPWDSPQPPSHTLGLACKSGKCSPFLLLWLISVLFYLFIINTGMLIDGHTKLKVTHLVTLVLWLLLMTSSAARSLHLPKSEWTIVLWGTFFFSFFLLINLFLFLFFTKWHPISFCI